MTARPTPSSQSRWATAAVIFSGLVLMLTLSPDGTVNSSNFVPFREHGAAWSCLLRNCAAAGASARFLVRDVIGNVVVFVPIGFAIYGATRGTSFRRFGLAVAFGFALSLFIEMVQFWIATRASDIDDLIFNTLGAVVGAALYRGFMTLRR